MARHRRVRSEIELQRRSPTRRPREFILVVCEGAETETNYFASLRTAIGMTKADVEIVGVGGGIISVAADAIRLRE